MAKNFSAVDCHSLIDTFKTQYHLDFELECFAFDTQEEDCRAVEAQQKDFLNQLAKEKEAANFSSRSHTSKLPGENFVAYANSENAPIGVDVESRKRDCAKACQRISDSDELLSAPSAQLLWTAKEASFKCLASLDKKPTLVSQIQTYNWQKESPNTYSFQAKFSENPDIKIRGTAGLNQLLALSVASFSDTSQFNT